MKAKYLTALLGLTFANSSVHAALIAYEGFQYSNAGDILMGEPDGAGTPSDIDATGLDGTYTESVWNDTNRQQLDIISGSLSFGNLPTAGNRVGSETTSDENIYTRTVTSSLSGTGNLWFSFLVQPNESNGASQAGIAITNQTLGQAKILNNTAQSGLVGFGVGSQTSANFQPYAWNGTTIVTGTTTNSALSTTDGATYFLIGHISYNSGTGGADVFELFSHGLNGGVIDGSDLTQIGDTLEVDIAEAGLDRLQITRQRRPSYDEIRIGTSLDDVLGVVPEPSAALTGGLGALLLLRRRR
jgi:hypothetical protein